MATGKIEDQFANLAIAKVVESAANTLTFAKLDTGLSFNEKVAWVISRIEYDPSGVGCANFADEADAVEYGLSVYAGFTTPSPLEITAIDYNMLIYSEVGAPTSFQFRHYPLLKDFSSMPGGGIIVPPVPLYAWVKGSGLASAVTIYARIFYTVMSLSADQYWQLVEARHVITT